MTDEGKKNDEGKLRWDLLPVKPMEKLVEVYTIGSKKYNDRNWEKGLKWGRVFAAMMRHAWAWWGGERLDQKDGQHHLGSVAWCALALMEYEETHPELDDRFLRRYLHYLEPVNGSQVFSRRMDDVLQKNNTITNY